MKPLSGNGLRDKVQYISIRDMGDTQKTTGRIYMIKAPDHEGCYVGSTTKTLEERLWRHKYDYHRYMNGKHNYMASFELVKHEGATIHLLHEGEFDSKRDLEKLEGSYINDLSDNAVNKKGAGMTAVESRIKWYATHKEAQLKRVTDYYVKNHESFLEKHTCDVCGGTYTRKRKAEHNKTKKHQKALESKSEEYKTSSPLAA